MEYISAEEFLKQPKEVQEVFLNWWNPSLGDLFARTNTKYLPHLVWKFEDECILSNCESFWKEKNDCIPLFTEGQLRQFVEYKVKGKADIYFAFEDEYTIKIINDNSECVYHEDLLGANLLQAYWKVALEIAKEGVENEIK